MTTYEHGMLGTTLALALGCQRRQGWPIVAAAAVASALPDWDGLSLAMGGAAYARVHRVWGHNVLVATCSGLLVGVTGYLWSLSLRKPAPVIEAEPHGDVPPQRSFTIRSLNEWIVICVLASLIHLPADMIYSGHPEMRNWPLQLLWPFSERGWVWPLVAWGNVGTSLLFVGEMFALYRWPKRTRSIAWLTLLALHGYILACGLSGGIQEGIKEI